MKSKTFRVQPDDEIIFRSHEGVKEMHIVVICEEDDTVEVSYRSRSHKGGMKHTEGD